MKENTKQRREHVDKATHLSVVRQCELQRSTVVACITNVPRRASIIWN